MRYGFVLPRGTAADQVAQAVLAEQAGWDGVFVWEAAYGVDAWTLLGAMAQCTTRVRLGTLLTPLPWRRPWKVASQALTLDQLSGGRAILAVGLGYPASNRADAREPADRRTRAALLDEGIAIITGLWEGRLRFSGQQYDVHLHPGDHLQQLGAPVQQPRIPIWVVGAWPRPKSMRRVLRCDGLLPVCMDAQGLRPTTPDDIRAMRQWLAEQGGVRAGFDIVMEGETPADDPTQAAAIVAPWAEAGCTWWLEARWTLPHHSPERMQQVRTRLAAGPP